MKKNNINQKKGILNSKLRKKVVNDLNCSEEEYRKIVNDVIGVSNILYEKRREAYNIVRLIQRHISRIANKPKEFISEVEKIELEIKDFSDKIEKIKIAEREAKAAGGSMGVGVTLSALGTAVATMGPTAAMSFATTFGVASTGTAIATLSGAAQTSAALAWLGGGALTASGGGMVAGNALIAATGPVGWTIAGTMFAASLGLGALYNKKNKRIADESANRIKELEAEKRKISIKKEEIKELIDTTESQMKGVIELNKSIKGEDYSAFSDDEKLQIGALVNNTLALAKLINKEVKING